MDSLTELDSIRDYSAESSPTRHDRALDKNGTPKKSAYFKDLYLQELQADLRSGRPAGRTDGQTDGIKKRYIITITFDKKKEKKGWKNNIEKKGKKGKKKRES